MEGFLAKNPGLRSRIAFHVPFNDYNSEELCEIARLMSKNSGMRFAEDAFTKLKRIFDTARKDKDFGNGRFVRNAFEQAKMNQAVRLCEKNFEDITADDVITITADDIVISQPSSTEIKRIGFC
jgi:hypothetical protein